MRARALGLYSGFKCFGFKVKFLKTLGIVLDATRFIVSWGQQGIWGSVSDGLRCVLGGRAHVSIGIEG